MKLLFSAFLVSALWLPPGEVRSVELPEVIQVQIQALSAEGDRFAEDGPYREALEKFLAAFALLPDPPHQWPACTRLLAAAGDVNFRAGAYELAERALSYVMHCPDASDNAFLHLRLGQTLFELGKREPAAARLVHAYRSAGREIFEADDPKYFEFLKTVMKPPAGGTW